MHLRPTAFAACCLILLTSARTVIAAGAETGGAATAAANVPADFTQAMERAAGDYVARQRVAAAELAALREKVAAEKTPLLQAQRAAEDRILAAESTLSRLRAGEHQFADDRSRLMQEATALHRNASYLGSLTQEGLKSFSDALAPGEEQGVGARLAGLVAAQENPPAKDAPLPAADIVDFLIERVDQATGGYAVAGSALVDDGNVAQPGVLAFVGPQTFFRGSDGRVGVVVRLREGAAFPMSYSVPAWSRDGAAGFFVGRSGVIAADPTGNKALRLKQTTGTVWQHIQKGGVVAYGILGVGLLAIALIVGKVVDVVRLRVDEPAAIRAFLVLLAEQGAVPARSALHGLRAATQEIVGIGLDHLDRPKAALEEHLQAALLRQRLHFERWLPLLAVIATAAPLMGLLGTVVGMVKTFALITVFGTGNAGKLASGISEVLVATELGLAVAIPTLVIHGFLAQQIQRRLALLERYALEFVTVVKTEEETVA